MVFPQFKKITLYLSLLGLIIGLVLSPASARTPLSQSTQPTEEEVKVNAEVVKLYNEGRYDEALPLAKRLLLIREKGTGKNSLIVASALNTIGAIQVKKEKYLEAAPFFERSLKITETIQGADSLSLCMILDSLALINFARGDFGKSEDQYKRALAIREEILGSKHDEVLNSLSRLADFYQSRERYKKAETHLQRIISVKESSGGPSSGLAESIYQYACLKRKMNEAGEAQIMEVRAEGLLDTSGLGVPTVLPTDFGLINGRALRLAQPFYPAKARLIGQTGTVLVRVLINEAGKVIRACAIQGPSAFWKATEAAAYRSLFSPTTVEGQPVKVTGFITYRFKAG